MSKANSLEWQMLDLINSERASIGLNPLLLDLRLNDAAEDHSQWMINTDTFSHTGIGGSAPWDRMEDAGFVFSGSWRAAENVGWQSVRGQPGLADDVNDIHAGLMNSPGHRANILSADTEVIGIGIERGDYQGWDGLFVTQNFARTAAPLELDSRTAPAPTPTPTTPDSSDGTLQIGAETVAQTARDIWHRVEFDQKIEDAVVVMGPVSNNDGDPVTIRVQNVTDTGFAFRMEEWEYQDGRHATETISWMAVSAGTHEMADGRTIKAGSSATDHTTARVDLGTSFDETPLVFTQVASNKGGDTVTSRLGLVSSDGFQFRLQEEEAKGRHVTEKVDWIAMEGGSLGDLTANIVQGVTHQSRTVEYDADQALFAQMQTLNGSDTANMRYDDLGGRAQIWVDEEASRDGEVKHINETIAAVTADLGTYDLIA
ncbi:CAP domain-containing protein [Roseobacter sp.]|uniref:CAP domain-containing protein n=1 Tax=Roseobacter sp. TaxID=1907202 RepID=UPI00385E8453